MNYHFQNFIHAQNPHAPTKAESFTKRKAQPTSGNSDRRKLVLAEL
jgi:hypothetical protein